MKGKRILLPALMALMLALVIIPLAAEKAYADTDNGGEWEFEPINDGYARVTKCLNKEIVDAVIPEAVKSGSGPQYLVTAVGAPDGEAVFSECYNLKSIKIHNNISRIEDDALSWPGDDIDSITFTGGDHLQYIGEYAFSGTNITSFQIPSTVTYIGDRAFDGCEQLKSIKIPAGVTRIGNGTFSTCTNLTSVTIPSSVKSIGEEAFDSSGLTAIAIPSGVTSIGARAFASCDALRSLSLPAGLKTIPEQMCVDCDTLASVKIPSSVTSIGWMAFAVCGLTSVTIPNSVTSVAPDAFYADTKLKSIAISNRMKAIPASMCEDCSALTSVTIPSGVTTIGEYAFRGCVALTTVSIPVSVRGIGASVFWRTNLKKVIYAGSQAQWKKIAINAENTELFEAAKVFKVATVKKANPLTAKAKTVTVKYKKVKKKTQTVKRAKAITVSKAQGTVSYKLVSVKKAKFKKYFKVNAKNGNITVKKKIKKGTYKVKIKVTAAGNAGFKPGTKTVTVKIKVK